MNSQVNTVQVIKDNSEMTQNRSESNLNTPVKINCLKNPYINKTSSRALIKS